MKKMDRKSIGLILAIIIAGISLPTSIVSFMNGPRIVHETIIENHYYNQTLVVNNTIIEEHYYNETIIEQYNNTIIEQYNNTIVINNTVYIPINRTMEYFHFSSVPANEFFFNVTFNLTDTTIVVFTVSSFLVGTNPTMWMYKNGGTLGYYQPFSVILGFVWTFGFYEVRFENDNLIQNIDITIELIEVL
ncbi:hypothetical protein LCGC14_2817370 [marine sediment metagenome]|uniref:Uncharacterized protein n=1 Tax=marine sediment metagenome TaxID=412755 RepID=A0A0F8YI25_9ZZZZ